MKIRRVMDKKVDDITYYKYLITLPKEVAERSSLLGKQLKAKIEGKKIVIEKD